jgi:hypothetical protein
MDGSQIWINGVRVDVLSLQVLGTSGIAVDNAVLPATLAGALQIYFSPLGSGSDLRRGPWLCCPGVPSRIELT